MKVEADKDLTVRTTPCTRASAKPVVRQLKEVYGKLALTEANIELLTRMTREAIATNDIRNFVRKQMSMRRVKTGLDKKIKKKLMKQKLDDACMLATRL